MIRGIMSKIVGKLTDDNMLLRRIVLRERIRKKYIKATALAFYFWPVKNSITLDEKITSYLEMAFKTYYNELQNLLKVAKVDGFELIRTGSERDGGYILLNNFHKGGIAYSFGISDDVVWDKYMTLKGYDVFMYDHTIEGLPEENPHFHFFKQGISDGKTQDERLKTLEYFIEHNHHEHEENMILKMDVEGAEWGFLHDVRSDTLQKFAQMTFEFHGANNPQNPELVLEVLKKINKTHQLIHIHANNNGSCIVIGGKKFCGLIECTYILREKYKFKENYDVVLPLNIDAPNMKDYPEIELGHWNDTVKIEGSVIASVERM